MKKLLCLFLPIFVLTGCTLYTFAGTGTFRATPGEDGGPGTLEIRESGRGLALGTGGALLSSREGDYEIFTEGGGRRFGPERIEIRSRSDRSTRPVAGFIQIDDSREHVTVQLKVKEGGREKDFKGNGTFRLKSGS